MGLDEHAQQRCPPPPPPPPHCPLSWWQLPVPPGRSKPVPQARLLPRSPTACTACAAGCTPLRCIHPAPPGTTLQAHLPPGSSTACTAARQPAPAPRAAAAAARRRPASRAPPGRRRWRCCPARGPTAGAACDQHLEGCRAKPRRLPPGGCTPLLLLLLLFLQLLLLRRQLLHALPR